MNALALVALVCLVGPGLAQFAPLSDDQIDYINSVQSSWVAGRNFDPSQLAHAKNLLGVDEESYVLYVQEHIEHVVSGPVDVSDLPVSFDPREQWPDSWTMKQVRDQSECGSCWAFSVASSLSDRIYVATGEDVRISAEDILACCGTPCGDGCYGGWPLAAFTWFVRQGVVTGGRFNSDRGCMPYSMPPCDHHVSGRLRNCSSEIRPTPECVPECREGYGQTYRKDKHFGSKAYQIIGVDNIMSELYHHGPVSASFSVFEDFYSYKSGVYKHVTGEYLGGHAVELIGWGVEDGQDYWLVVNSWNRDWGDKGLFKIARGDNECKFEDHVMAATIKV